MATRILIGDVRDRLKELPDQSVHCCVTSPPYYGLRDYGVAGQIGLESTLAEYITNMVDVFREVRRVLRDDGVCFVNIGDSYAGSWGNYSPGGIKGTQRPKTEEGERWERKAYDDTSFLPPSANAKASGLKPKDLMLVPERLALALQADGWWIRSRIIWAKKACMPESVTDRPTNAHEHIWLLTKSARYFYDAEAVREENESAEQLDHNQRYAKVYDAYDETAHNRQPGNTNHLGIHARGGKPGRNQRNVWHLGPEPFPDAHFATFPTEIPRRAIKAGTSEHGCCEACGAPWVRMVEREMVMGRKSGPGNRAAIGDLSDSSVFRTGLQPVTQTIGWAPSCQCDAGVIPCMVLDPFLGSGTTLMVADQLGRHGIGIELNPEYAAMAERRIRGDAPMFADVTIETASRAGYIDSEVA